jgi:hypothetical protein
VVRDAHASHTTQQTQCTIVNMPGKTTIKTRSDVYNFVVHPAVLKNIKTMLIPSETQL